MPKECWNCKGIMVEKTGLQGKYFECPKCKATDTVLMKLGQSALAAPDPGGAHRLGSNTPRPIRRPKTKKEKVK